MNLTSLGWNATLDEQFRPYASKGWVPGRVSRTHGGRCFVLTDAGELLAETTGRLRHEADGPGGLPAVGDWVAVAARPAEGAATLHAILPRRSCFSREAAGGGAVEQVVAANVDTVLLVSGLDGDFNLRRIERYLTLAYSSGAVPVIVLNKADLCDDVDARVGQVETVACAVPVHPLSAAAGDGLDALHAYLKPGRTVALLGSSGVGKSTLINALLGFERQAVRAVRADDSRGRHTTTCRELIPLPTGALLVDTPGLRELRLWGDDEGLSGAFADVEALAARCRFRDCAHRDEPGCAVQAALADGTLDAARFESYLRLGRELRHLEAKQQRKVRLAEKARWKKLCKLQQELGKARRRAGRR